jgi:hypothetical protein
MMGFRVFLAFAMEKHALSFEEADERWQRAWQVMESIARTQMAQQNAADPVQRFFELLLAAIASGQAHLATRDGGVPETPGAWGWRESNHASDGFRRSMWEPQGRRVGWVDEEGIYLVAEAAYQAANGVSVAGQEAIHITPTTLWRRLQERGLLASCDADRRTLKMRRTIEGQIRTVLMLQRSTFDTVADKAGMGRDIPCSISTIPLSA